MRTGILATLALSLTTVAAAQPSTTSDGNVALRGVVFDASSGAAIRRARVEVTIGPGRFAVAMSDDEGRFSLDAPADMPATVRIGKAGYGAATRALFPLQLRDRRSHAMRSADSLASDMLDLLASGATRVLLAERQGHDITLRMIRR